MTWPTALIWLTSALALAALAYQCAALLALTRFFAPPPPARPSNLAVTLLKPLYGAEPMLAENLAGFLAQDHAGPMQMVCGTTVPHDSAIPAVKAVQAAHPGADITLVVGGGAGGENESGGKDTGEVAANGKIGNLCHMLPAARYDVLVLSDSDMAVGRDYLPKVLAALEQPGVGAVSCLYVGRGDAGFWSQLGAAAISWQMMPNMVIGQATGMARPCMGSTIALRRPTLDAMGGFARFAHVLADDHAIGAGVAAQGLAVAIPPLLLTHAGTEASAGQLWRHHLRWAVTIRALAGAGHYGSLLTHALPLALIAMAVQPVTGAGFVAAALALRLVVARKVCRLVPGTPPPIWLLPLADCFEFAVFCASLFARRIDWRGVGLTMAADGRITASARHRSGLS